MKALTHLFSRELAWEATQAEQPDTVLMPDWVPEDADSEQILLADITGDRAGA